MASPKKIKIYEYSPCSTCKKALQFLKKKKVDFEPIPIVDRPPSLAELQVMLESLKKRGGSIKSLFNTSGVLYREMGVSEKLKKMTEADALALLSSNGKLIKRPFLLGPKAQLVGFKEEEWLSAF